ncbi:MAG: C40 family peptidase [Bacteroidota bacterium]
MRIRTLTCLFIFLALSGCIVKKKTTYSKTRTVTVESKDSETTTKTSSKKKRTNKKADNIVAKAMTYSGTRYKFGGTTKRGMDCSGLVYVALKENDIPFPRVSHQMANEGKRVKLKEVEKGDLLFFKTIKNGKRINHVGLVVNVDGDDIQFIHSTSSRGVIVSSLREGFWNHSFIKATRIL